MPTCQCSPAEPASGCPTAPPRPRRDRGIVWLVLTTILACRGARFTRRRPVKVSELPSNEAGILSRIVGLDEGALSAAAARGILRLGFSDADNECMHR